jgi:methionyl-tRNA formyltransferase
MKQISETIVFFGSGPVAAESLRLLARSFTIEAVVTKPRPAHHRGDVPVLTVAEDLGLRVVTAANRKDLDTVFAQKSFNSRVAVLIDFGIIVSKEVIDYFPLGIVNSHFSLLPEWRGADPITFAILSGQKQTGVSLMLLVPAMDEGPLLGFGTCDLPPTITTPELTQQLILLSYELLRVILPKYIASEIPPQPQDSSTPATYSRKLTKEDGTIDWHKSAQHIEREIRAFAEWPKSRTRLGSIDVILTRAHVTDSTGTPGSFTTQNKQLLVHCGEGSLMIEALKPAGKQEMTGEAFLAGYKR